MGLGNKGNKFNFGDNDLADEASGADGDEGDGFGSVACSICLETVVKNGDRAWANLQCDHQFHLDCIGSAFNAKGVMQCPNCRKVEKGQWLYANGCRSYPEFNVEDWVHEEDIYDIGAYSEMSFGVHWCPFGSSARLPSFEDGEFSPSSYHDLLGQQGYYTEPAAPTAGHPCPYVTYFGPVHSPSSSSGGAAGVSDSSSFSSHWNTGSSVSGEVPTPYGFPVDPHYHGWDYHPPPPPPPQHFSASGAHVGSPTQPTPPPAAARTSRANGSDMIRPRPPHFTRPFHGHSSSGRAGSSVASVPRTPPFPGSNARTRDRMQALQAYYQQSSAQSHQPDSPIVSRGPVFPSGRRPARGIASGMGSTSSSSDQAGGSGFIRFNIWERDPYMQSQQAYSVNQMDREPNIWTSSFNEGSGSFHQRHGGGTDLSHSTGLVSELQTEISELDQRLAGLNRQLESGLAAYASFSDRVGGLFFEVNAKLADLSSSTSVTRSASDSGKEEEATEHVAGEDLPSLAKEVAQVESVRAYAETALKLDTLVGDIEDAVMSSLNKNLRTSRSSGFEEVRLHAIKTLKTTEEILSSVAKRHPRWARLVSAVDHRVDRALAMMRPQAIADYRALLSSLRWPPQLSTLTSASLDSKSENVQNPLFNMEGSLKSQYCGSFHALCSLQGLQLQRKSRQLGIHKGENVLFHQPLWAIEELVNPLTVASQRHFTKWSEKPEFIFALVYKITRDYVDSMDELLQPLVDEAKLAGYSCREEWVSAMVSSLSLYLVKEIFPIYVGQLDEANETDLRSEAKVSWLHLIDLMISFDKRVQSLVSQSGILSLQEDGNLLRISSLSVFCDRPDWLDLWAEIELDERLVKFKEEIDNDRNWTAKVQDELISSSNVYRPPIISSIFLQHLSSIIERSKSVPALYLRARFLRLAASPTIHKFLDCLLLRCQDADGLTALTENNDLIKVSNSINAGHYIESVLEEWSEDVFFLEMGTGQHDPQEVPGLENFTEPSEGIFGEEFEKLEKFRLEWINKLSVVILRGFDARIREYIKNRKQWQEKKDKEWTVSRALVGALDYLQGKTSIIEENLNKADFTAMWRTLASEIDKLFFNSILMANVKFTNDGVERLKVDMEVLYGVFRTWCVRPEGFFPKLSEGLTLLKMEEKQVKDGLSRGDKWLRENRIRYLSEAEAKKVAKSRVFS